MQYTHLNICQSQTYTYQFLAGSLMSTEFRVSIGIELLVAVTAFVSAGCRGIPMALLVLPSRNSSNLGGHSETMEFNKMGFEISLHQLDF